MNANNSTNHKYDEIIGRPHHVSEMRPLMPMSDRAAQFSPFAALTGYASVIRETERTWISAEDREQ